MTKVTTILIKTIGFCVLDLNINISKYQDISIHKNQAWISENMKPMPGYKIVDNFQSEFIRH